MYCSTMKLVTNSIADRLGSARLGDITLHYIFISSHLAFVDLIYFQAEAKCEEDS